MITMFNREFPLYGLLCTLGIVCAAAVAFLLIKRRGITFFDFLCASVFILIGAFIGAKTFFIVVSIKQIIQMELSFEEIMRGGFVFYGGLFGGAVALWLYAKIYKEDLGKYLDVCSVVLPLGHAFGRIGCFKGGCCYGIEYRGFGSYVYLESLNVNTPIGVPLLPIQLIESVCLYGLFVLLLVLFLKKGEKANVCLIYTVVYAAMRFILEFFRGDKERGKIIFSTSQWLSIFLLAGVLVYCFRRSRKRNSQT